MLVDVWHQKSRNVAVDRADRVLRIFLGDGSDVVEKLRIRSDRPMIFYVHHGSGTPRLCKTGFAVALIAFLLAAPWPVSAREKDTTPYGEGLIVNVPFPQSDVVQVIQEVVQNGIIRGTKEYNKDEFVSGATAEPSVKVFPAWTEGGQVFYKVRAHALDPRNFKNGGDVGTLAVRYVVLPQGEKNTVLHINAIFVEDFRRTAHLSNGSVESAEYKDIHDRLDAIAEMNTQTAEAIRERQALLAQKAAATTEAKPAGPVPADAAASNPVATSPAATNVAVSNSDALNSALPDRDTAASTESTADLHADAQTTDKRLQDLKRQVERLVKAPGAALRAAPFHTASTLKSLPAGTEVLIVITTPYWLGIETHDGQHGWMLRDDLELLP